MPTGTARQGRAIQRDGLKGGFTLIELTLVVLIIAMILAIAVPRVVPAIAYSELEGAARHLSGYGRALIAHSALTKESVTFRLNLDQGEYWSVRWTLTEEEAEPAAADSPRALPLNDEDAQRAEELTRQFERFARLAAESRARSLRRQDGILAEIGPLFEKEFDLEWEEESVEEIKTDLLSRTRLPKDVRFESVRVGGQEFLRGMVEIEVTPLGLADPIEIVLASERGRYSVEWDAVTGGTRIRSDRETQQ